MKGVIFTTFLESVESAWGLDMVDKIIENSDLASEGSYTAVGTYDHQEAVALISALSEETGTSVSDLLKGFGEHLFGVLITGHPHFAAGVEHPLDFLEGVERYIHVEVKKLYPDAQLPSFECARQSDDCLEMIYASGRHLEDLCEGLILGCVSYFSRESSISRETLEDGRERFLIQLSEPSADDSEK